MVKPNEDLVFDGFRLFLRLNGQGLVGTDEIGGSHGK